MSSKVDSLIITNVLNKYKASNPDLRKCVRPPTPPPLVNKYSNTSCLSTQQRNQSKRTDFILAIIGQLRIYKRYIPCTPPLSKKALS